MIAFSSYLYSVLWARYPPCHPTEYHWKINQKSSSKGKQSHVRYSAVHCCRSTGLDTCHHCSAQGRAQKLREELRKWGPDSPFQYLRASRGDQERNLYQSSQHQNSLHSRQWHIGGKESKVLAPVISASVIAALETTAQRRKEIKGTCTPYLRISPRCTRDNGIENRGQDDRITQSQHSTAPKRKRASHTGKY